MGTAASSTRGVVAGGAAPSLVNIIEYFTIGSTGNATDFGDLTDARSTMKGSGNNSTRAVFCGGLDPGASNIMDYITIASTGDAADFGDLIAATAQINGVQSNGHGGLD